jgi:predicted site-specific integrase-resolvase
MTNPMQDALTPAECARRSGLSHATIIRCFDKGLLKGYKLPGSRYRRILPSDLAKFMQEHGIPCGATKAALGAREVDAVMGTLTE